MRKFGKTIFSLGVFLGLSLNVNALTMDEINEKIAGGEKNIQLTENIEGFLTVDEGKEVVLDLNGYTLSGSIDDLGTLTVKSSKDGGQIVKQVAESSAVYVGDFDKKITGKFTLESGKIVSKQGANPAGISCFNGSTVIVNGGEIDSIDAALTGNNTLGTMNFIINGGTLTTRDGAAIYMPGPATLKVTGGTLNGGISLRMGKVDISGGKIIATNGSIDSVKEYYNYSGNAWFADALYVWGGTYTSKDEGYTNDLDLNITGGEFITENKQGSAIAIYDMGLVEQNIKVNISGNVKATTNTSDRTGYDVLSLSEAGVTEPKTGYGVYSGKVASQITGGTFTGDVSKYVVEGYVANLNNGVSNVAKREIKVVTPDISDAVKDVAIGVNGDVKDTLDKSLENSNIDIKKENPTVEVSVKSLDTSDVPKDVSTKIDDFIKMSSKNLTVANYFDISLLVKNSNNEKIGELSEVVAPIEFKVALTDELKNVKDGYVRSYYILRIHDDKTEIIPAKLDGGMLVFSSDKFSNYVLAYEDTADVKNPATLDNIASYVITGVLSITAFIGAAYIIKKKCK